jgi:DNA uptake protein ComE-like DNA-binding protein
MRILAGVAVLIFVTGSGWAADPKTAVKSLRTPEQKMEKKADPATALIDLNTATKEQLMTLAGVGDLAAQRIIRSRPFAKKDQLKSMKILTPQEYDRITDRIIARQPAKKN